MSSANTSGSARILACSLCDQARKDACAISLVTSFVTAKALTGPRLIAGGNAPGRRATNVLTLKGSELSFECDPFRVKTSCGRSPGATPPAITSMPVRHLADRKLVTKLMACAPRDF